ncbi:hypothetical protein PpBr36_07745 [Pyricularia pennisetigena]|uniref:hypothetical protein n=1 Tax=Pyricularia pennisetigena TaxID=1578925 RepID=UPI001150469A|nr:hypothetical protein PpBr36_07745 [Pyricularia pennisetigena]TLS25920.1 hypothetical protein PpBr36_07745 [Pyricularia pennisetigena]
MFGRRHHQTTTAAPARRHRTHRTHHTTTTTTAPRRGLFSRRQPVVHQKRHATMGDKISGAFLKLKGSLTRRPGQKAAGTRRMRGTDGRGSRRSYRY